jgi:ribosomal-protein-serine acetyltransferase
MPSTSDILRDIPDAFDSERLTIRSPRPGDGAELNAAVLESWAELRPWLPWTVTKPTVEESESTMRQAYARFVTREDLWLLLFLKKSNTLVGSSGLHVRDWNVPRFEIGYWLRTRFTGQGYMTEAVRAIAEFGFGALGAQRLEIHCDRLNQSSVAVARRAGFKLEGALHHHHRHHLTGELRDIMLFARLAGDYLTNCL